MIIGEWVCGAEGNLRARDSINISTPLLRYSYRPAVNIFKKRHVRNNVSECQTVPYVDRIVEIEIVMTIEMASHELVDLSFRCRVQILKFVHSLEFDNVEPIWEYPVRFPLQ
jgi:hypothetical protein